GVASLAAVALGASSVLATDVYTVPLALIDRAAKLQQEQQLALSAVVTFNDDVLRTCIFDVCGPEPLPPAGVVVISDMFYNHTVAWHVGRRAVEAWDRGSTTVVSDPGRSGRTAFFA
ncbi:unnamed protein product, partial [Phaeothamnion confervicola]